MAPRIIAHRGASAEAPENTMPAFERALLQRADAIELDCRLSADGVVMVIHDKDLDRTTSGTGPIYAQTAQELDKLDAGAWKGEEFKGTPLPRFDDVLDFAQGRIPLLVELKPFLNDRKLLTDLAARGRMLDLSDLAAVQKFMADLMGAAPEDLALLRGVVSLVRARNMQSVVTLQSFSPIVCAMAMLEAPEFRRELLLDPGPNGEFPWEETLHGAQLLGLGGVNLRRDIATRERIEALHKQGCTISVWTVDEDEEIRSFAALGVDALITNRPGAARKILETLNIDEVCRIF